MNEISKKTLLKRVEIILYNPNQEIVKEFVELGYTIKKMKCINENYTYFLRKEREDNNKSIK